MANLLLKKEERNHHTSFLTMIMEMKSAITSLKTVIMKTTMTKLINCKDSKRSNLINLEKNRIRAKSPKKAKRAIKTMNLNFNRNMLILARMKTQSMNSKSHIRAAVIAGAKNSKVASIVIIFR